MGMEHGIELPPHKCGLTIEHNEHKNLYQTAAQYLDDYYGHYVFRSDRDRERCIELDEVWTMQWYPETPIGFVAIAAPTLSALIEFAKSDDSPDKP